MDCHEGGEVLDLNAQTTTPDQLQLNRRGYKVKSPWVRNLLTFLMVFGPGLIVMEADNDAGAVSTYTQAGAQYGLHLLWVLLLLLPVCYFIQEMVARLGIATGKGPGGQRSLMGSWSPLGICTRSVKDLGRPSPISII